MATDDGIRKTNDIIRQTYDQLVRTRNAQLKYMADLRRKKKEFGFIVTPDLVLQYNYVHQLMRSFRTGMPPDICVKDGGITCSNLSVLKDEQITGGGRLDSFPATLPAADDSDYLASRIVDLLDRPVTDGDQDLTVNVRDEFAANIRTLNLLFEERYKLCQEQGDRLRTELIAVRKQLESSRAAASEAASKNSNDQTIRRMRDQIARYETQLRIVREHMEALQEMNENAIQRNQRELETLIRRFSQSSARNENDDAILSLLRKLVESLESERDHVVAAVQQITSVNERRSDEFSRLMDDRRSAAATVVNDEEQVRARVENAIASQQRDYESRVEKEVNDRMLAVESVLRAKLEAELTSRTEDLKRRFVSRTEDLKSRLFNEERLEVEKEVNDRMLAVESVLRAKLEAELTSRTEDLKRRFDDDVATKVSQALGTADTVRVVTADQVSAMLQPQQRISSDDADLRKYKQTLDGLLLLKDSVLDVVPLLPQYELPAGNTADYELMKSLYSYTSYLLEKMRDVYRFLIAQSDYLYSIGITAFRENVSLESMTRDRTDTFNERLNQILGTHVGEKGTLDNRVLELLERILGDLPQLKDGFEQFYRDRNFYQMNEQLLNQKDDEIYELRLKVRDPLTARERCEYEHAKKQNIVDRTTIRELQLAVEAFNREKNRSSYYKDPRIAASLAAQADLKRETSLRKELLMDVRRVYNDLAHYAIKLGNEFRRWFLEQSKATTDRQPTVLRDYVTDLNNFFSKADRTINFGESPRADKNPIASAINTILHGGDSSRRGITTSGNSYKHTDRWRKGHYT